MSHFPPLLVKPGHIMSAPEKIYLIAPLSTCKEDIKKGSVSQMRACKIT